MGDHVSVTLTVPTELADRADVIMRRYDGSADSSDKLDHTTDFEFGEVNYGELDAEKHLTAAGIAWVKTWGRGGGFNPGTAWAMFDEHGQLWRCDMPDESPEDTLAPFFALLEEPEALLEALKIEMKKLTSLPWDNQPEYGKRYLAAKLINPSMLIDVTDKYPSP